MLVKEPKMKNISTLLWTAGQIQQKAENISLYLSLENHQNKTEGTPFTNGASHTSHPEGSWYYPGYDMTHYSVHDTIQDQCHEIPVCYCTHYCLNLQMPFLSNFSSSLFSDTFTGLLLLGMPKACCGGRPHWWTNCPVRHSSRTDPNCCDQCFESATLRKLDFTLLPQGKIEMRNLSLTVFCIYHTGKIFRSEFSKNTRIFWGKVFQPWNMFLYLICKTYLDGWIFHT